MAMIEMTCPWCLREVTIEEQDLRDAEFRCPECGSTAPWAPDPTDLVQVKTPQKQASTSSR